MDQLSGLRRHYERALRDGGAVLMVRVRGDADRRRAAVARRSVPHGGHFVNYYGRFATEELDALARSRARHPEPDAPLSDRVALTRPAALCHPPRDHATTTRGIRCSDASSAPTTTAPPTRPRRR